MTLGLTAPAFAQLDLFSADTISGRLDLRAGAANGETSWVDGGFGKSRFGGSPSGGWEAQGKIADAILQWKPNFSWGLSGVVDAEYQSDQKNPLGFTEAYLQYKPLLAGGTHVSARAGMFFPPISMEHDGPAWTTTRTITPSAINSWVSEEVKGTGLEGTVRHSFAGQELGLTAGAFESNDTSGTLLGFRGWSLSDERDIARGRFALPPLGAFDAMIQPPFTTPSLELDHRLGYYVRADWRPPAPFSLNAIHYDNQGDQISVNHQGQWSWRTQFNNVGAAWKPADNTEVLAQAMQGRTRMGYKDPTDGIWVYQDFSAAYVLVSQTFGRQAITGRLDAFSTNDEADDEYGHNSENGWAMTAAWKRVFSPSAQVLLEVVRTDSTRAARLLAGDPPHQIQTVIQASTRLSF